MFNCTGLEVSWLVTQVVWNVRFCQQTSAHLATLTISAPTVSGPLLTHWGPLIASLATLPEAVPFIRVCMFPSCGWELARHLLGSLCLSASGVELDWALNLFTSAKCRTGGWRQH